MAVVGGLFILFLVVIAVVVVRVVQDPKAQKVFRAAQTGVSVYMEASRAPGTDELRAAGCREAMAIDAAQILEIGREFMDPDGGTAPEDPELAPMTVVCSIGWRSELDCDQVAQTYLAAVPEGPEPIAVTVTVKRFGGDEQRCAAQYSRQGQRLDTVRPDTNRLDPDRPDTDRINNERGAGPSPIPIGAPRGARDDVSDDDPDLK